MNMIVYKITNKINGKIYIGQTIQGLSKRWNGHVHNNASNSAISSAIKKYGSENFTIESLVECFSVEEMNQNERFFIKALDTIAPNGYNLKPGGAQGGPLSEASKLKISMTKKGKPSNRLGWHHSEASNLKNSIAHLGRKMSDDSKQKLSKTNTGKTKPKIAIDKIKKPVICNETGIIYPSVKEAGAAFGVVDKAIRRVLKGERKHYKGLTFSYLEKNNV